MDWIIKSNPDFLCLQETKLSSENFNIDKLNLSYKNIIINNSVLKKGFSGTITLSKFKSTSYNFCNIVDYENDGRIIEQHFNNFVLFNVYFPNGKTSEDRLKRKIEFYKAFLEYSINLRKEGKNIIICGDFNTAHKDIDLKETKIHNKLGFSKNERECLNDFIKNGFIDSYRYLHPDKKSAYSWWSYRSNGREKGEGWRIDYILISDNVLDNLIDSYILDDVNGSDHCPIGIKIKL